MTQYFGGGSSGGALSRAHARIAARQQASDRKDAAFQRAKAQAAKKNAQHDDGFSLTDLAPNFGLGEVVKSIPGIFTGAYDLATGRGGYGHAWGNLGKGVLSSLASTARTGLDVSSLGLIEASGLGNKGSDALGNFLASNDAEDKAGVWKPSGIDKYWEQGIAPALIEDVGNVALVGGAASKLAKLGTVGRAAEAVRTAEVAGKAGFAADEVAKAADVAAQAGRTGRNFGEAGIKSKVLRAAGKAGAKAAEDSAVVDAADVASRVGKLKVAEAAAHPYHSLFSEAIRPLARAAQNEQITRIGRGADAVATGAENLDTSDATRVPETVGAPSQYADLEQLGREAAAATVPTNPRAGNEALLAGNAEPTVSLFRGEPSNFSGAPSGLNFHADEAYARNFAGADGTVRRVDVPQSVADESRQVAEHLTASGQDALTPGTHALPPEWADAAYAHESPVPPTALNEIPQAVQAAVDARGAERAPEWVIPPRVGPHELAQRVRQPVPDWAQRLVQEAAPEASTTRSRRFAEAVGRGLLSGDRVVERLAKGEGWIEGRELSLVKRERELMQVAAQREMFHHPAVQGLVQSGRDLLVGQHLADGTELTPDLINEMLGNAVIARLTGTDKLAAALPEGAPRQELSRIVGEADHTIPPELMTPELDGVISTATEQWRSVYKDRLAILEGGRLGSKGLEQVGADTPRMNQTQVRLWNEVQTDYAKAARLDPQIAKQADRALAKIDTAEGKIRALDELMLRLEDRKAKAATVVQALFGDVPPDGRTLRQVASQMRQIVGESPAKARQRGYRAGKVAEEFDAAQSQIRVGTRRRAALQAGLDDVQRTLTEHALPGELQKSLVTGHAQRRIDTLAKGLDNPSVAATPDQWKPLYGAIKELHKLAEDNPQLAEAMAEIPDTLSGMFRFAAEQGIDPTFVSSLTNTQVRNLVYEQVRLGKRGIDKVEEAGTRKLRKGAQAESRGVDALAAGVLAPSHEANTNALVTHIEDTYARDVPLNVSGKPEVPNGWHAWDPERNFLLRGERTDTGFQIAGKGGPTRMIPDSVKKTIDTFSNDSKYSHAAFRAMRRVANPWRAFVLTWSPRWYVNNFVGNVVLASKEGVGLHDWASAWHSYRQRGDAAGARQGALSRAYPRLAQPFADIPEVTQPGIVGEIGGDPHLIPYPDGWNAGSVRQGIRDTVSGISMAKRTGGIREAYNQVAGKVARANEVVDEFARAAVYHKTMRVGGTKEEALARSFEAMVDYGNLSPFEREVVRSIVPFYAWQKAMFKAVTKFPIDHPAAAGLAMQAGALNKQLNIEEYGTDLPAAYKSLIDLPFIGTINTRGFNPLADSASLLTPQGIAASVNPFVDAAIRNALGAPEGGFVKHQRVNEFGTAVPDTSPAEDLVGIGQSLPQYQVATGVFGNGPYPGAPTGVQAAERFSGLPTYTPAQVRKIIARAVKARQRTG